MSFPEHTVADQQGYFPALSAADETEQARVEARDRMRRRRSADPEKNREYEREYYARNREKLTAYKKSNRIKNDTPERKAAKQEYNRRYREANREKMVARSKAHYEANKEFYRFKSLASKYGVTREQYDHLMTKQKGRCAICETPFGTTRQTWAHVDHCHDSSRIRGLLCTRCNPMIGYAKDDPKILRAAIRYLAR